MVVRIKCFHDPLSHVNYVSFRVCIILFLFLLINWSIEFRRWLRMTRTKSAGDIFSSILIAYKDFLQRSNIKSYQQTSFCSPGYERLLKSFLLHSYVCLCIRNNIRFNLILNRVTQHSLAKSYVDKVLCLYTLYVNPPSRTELFCQKLSF